VEDGSISKERRREDSTMAEYSIAANCFRVLFIIMNVIFVILGTGLIGLGSYLINLGRENDYDIITGDEFFSGAAVLVAAGIFTFLLAALGILGAAGMWRPVLALYILTVVTLIVLQIAGGILGFVYRDTIADELEQRVNDTFLNYTSGPDDPEYREEINDLVAYVQNEFECCGINSHMDWLTLHPDVFEELGNQPPAECLCMPDVDSNCETVDRMSTNDNGAEIQIRYSAWNQGCLEVIEDSLDELAIGVGIVGIVIGTIEIFGILVAVGLIVCITKTNKDSYV
jgi:hypothetical protein